MIHRLNSWSIRVYLMILIILLAIPSISLIVNSGLSERRAAIADAKAECLKFVDDAAAQQQALVAGAEQLATALALLPPIQSRNPAAASALFSDLLKKNPQYINILVCDASGLVWASALPFEGKVSLAGRTYIQEAARTGVFSSGESAVGRISKKPSLGFGYPVKNAGNQVIGVIGIIQNLDYSQQMFASLNLPPTSSFSVLDRLGTIIIRNLSDPFSQKLMGGRDTREGLFTTMAEGPDEGTPPGIVGNDGRLRLWAYKKIRLPHDSKPYVYLRASIPLASATRAANAAMFRSLSAFVSLFLIGLFLAWLIGKRLIVRPAMMLKGASEQLAAGADTINVSSFVKGGELGEVARAFDGMAEALVQEKTALRESRQRWATTLASIGDAVIATDVQGKIAFMNAVAEELTGWTVTDAAAKPVSAVFTIVNEQTRREVENPITKVLREGMIVGLANHTILIRKDGKEVPIDDSGAPIRDADGKTTGVVLVFRDITERKQAEKELRDTHRLFADVIDGSSSPIFLKDREGRFITINTPLEKMLGMTREELKGKTDYDIAPKDVADCWHSHDTDVMRTGQPLQIEEVADLLDGHHVFLANKFPLVDATGEIYGVGAISHDITDRKLQEARIARLTQLYAMLSLVNEAIVRTSEQNVLFEEVCRIIAKEGAFPLVWIGEVKDRQLAEVASCGPAAGYLSEIRVEVDAVLGQGPGGTCIREDRPVVNDDFDTNPATLPWREPALRHGFRSSAAFPLRRQGKVFGALTLYATGPQDFDAEQVELLKALAADVSYALDTLEQERLRTRAENDLHRSLARFELLAHTADELLQSL